MHFLMGLYILISTNAKKLQNIISAVKRSEVKIFASFVIRSGLLSIIKEWPRVPIMVMKISSKLLCIPGQI